MITGTVEFLGQTLRFRAIQGIDSRSAYHGMEFKFTDDDEATDFIARSLGDVLEGLIETPVKHPAYPAFHWSESTLIPGTATVRVKFRIPALSQDEQR